MKIIDKSVYCFSRNNEPCEVVLPGELLLFRTMDCFSNKLISESMTAKDLDYSYSIANPTAGPVYIKGAEVGDVLVVEILDIRVGNEGTICTFEGCGPLHEDMELRTKKIPIKDGVANFNELKFLIEPMVGVIGTAPEKEDVINGYPGNHGGNMDSKLIKKGAKIYFPVRVPGGLLQLGDVHAAMGDSELCGTGIEVEAETLVRTYVIKNFKLNWPVTETPSHWYVNSCAQEFNEALVNASKELQRLIMNITGWDKTDTYMYMSVQCDVELNQACKPCEVPLIVRFGIKKLTEFDILIK